MVDFEEIKKRVTIEDILIDCGFFPRKNRMACPLHDGDNPTSFSFTDHSYHCFSCGAAGGLLDLAQALLKVNRAEALKYLAEKAQFRIAGQISVPGRGVSGVPHSFNLDSHFTLKFLELDYKELDFLLDYYTLCLRKARRFFHAGIIETDKFYSIAQYAEYVLDELNVQLIEAKYEISIERKRLREARMRAYSGRPGNRHIKSDFDR